ncbi:MAG: mechanosensitive ion channel domain-containing protein [Actinomycetota bacterium]
MHLPVHLPLVHDVLRVPISGPLLPDVLADALVGSAGADSSSDGGGPEWFSDLVGVDLDEATVSALRTGGRLLGLVVAVFVVRFLVRRFVRRVDDDRLREQLLFVIPKIVMVAASIAAIALVGVDVSSMAAILATVGFTGAVVFTSVGQNLVAGAMIRIDDVYRLGEAVTVGDLSGIVVYRTMLRTEIEMPDGSKAWVPNSSFQDGQVLNHSRLGGWRIMVQVPLDRATDRAVAHDIMTQVMGRITWNCPGKRAFVAFDHVGGEAMFFNAYAWIIDRTQEPWYRGLLLGELVDALEARGVSVGQTTNLSLRPDSPEG